DDAAAVLRVLDQPVLPQHAQVVRHVHDRDAEQLGELPDVERSLGESVQDLETGLLTDRRDLTGRGPGVGKVHDYTTPHSDTLERSPESTIPNNETHSHAHSAVVDPPLAKQHEQGGQNRELPQVARLLAVLAGLYGLAAHAHLAAGRDVALGRVEQVH